MFSKAGLPKVAAVWSASHFLGTAWSGGGRDFKVARTLAKLHNLLPGYSLFVHVMLGNERAV